MILMRDSSYPEEYSMFDWIRWVLVSVQCGTSSVFESELLADNMVREGFKFHVVAR